MVGADREDPGRVIGAQAHGGDAGADHGPSYAHLLGGLQHVPGAEDVGAEVLLVGRLDAGVDRRQVDHPIVSREGPSETIEVENVGLGEHRMVGRWGDVEDGDLVTAGELRHHVATEPSAAPRYRDPLQTRAAGQR